MFVVMVMSVRRSTTVHTETVSKEDNINHNNSNLNNNNNSNLNNLKNINCINSHLKIIENSDKNSYCCTIDKTIKRILPITLDSTTNSSITNTTILSPSALTAAQNTAQNSNKYLLTELNNYRKPPTIQVS
jgi:hypothetical protein